MTFRVLLALSALAACVIPEAGNYARHGVEVDAKIAEDALQKLRALYPPGKTPIVLAHEVMDPFGEVLVEGLRTAGYAVREARDERSEVQGREVYPLRYVVDRVEEVSRVTIWIGPDALNRLYDTWDGRPMGSWTWKRRARNE